MGSHRGQLADYSQTSGLAKWEEKAAALFGISPGARGKAKTGRVRIGRWHIVIGLGRQQIGRYSHYNAGVMTMRTLHNLVGACSLALAGLALGVSPAWPAEVWLEARPLVGTEYPAGIPPSVPMWGYASCDAAWACGPASVPGPQLVVPAGDPGGLTIHLRNSLPAAGLTVPNMTSIVIPGQRENGMAPVMFPP